MNFSRKASHAYFHSDIKNLNNEKWIKMLNKKVELHKMMIKKDVVLRKNLSALHSSEIDKVVYDEWKILVKKNIEKKYFKAKECKRELLFDRF